MWLVQSNPLARTDGDSWARVGVLHVGGFTTVLYSCAFNSVLLMNVGLVFLGASCFISAFLYNSAFMIGR